MARIQYPQEFRDEAVRQVIDGNHPVAEIADRLGVTRHTLCRWVRAAKPAPSERQAADLREARDEIKRLERELRRTREERDVPRKAAAYFAKDPD